MATEWSKHVALLSFANSRVSDVCQQPDNKQTQRGSSVQKYFSCRQDDGHTP